jgi:hypothetical protein
LSSQKKVERAATLFMEVPEADGRLSAHVQKLVAAIAMAREKQQAAAQAIQARAEEWEKRSLVLRQLIEKYGELGQSAAGLNQAMQELAAAPLETNGRAGPDPVKLSELVQRMEEVAGQAQRLGEESSAHDFEDIARMTDGLRQQLLSARNKAQLLFQSLPSS